MRKMARYVARIGILILLASASVLPAGATVTGSVTLSSPGTGIHRQDDDYFSTVWANPRDMEDARDIYVIHSTCGVGARSKWASASYSSGLWQGQTGSSGDVRQLWILNPGWGSTLGILEDGETKPVDAGKYRQLTFRMYSSHDNLVAQVFFTKGTIGTTWDDVPYRIYSGWNVYTLDMADDSNWSGNVTGMWLDYSALPAGVDIYLDWVVLTPKPTSQVSWSGSGSEAVSIYVASDPSFSDAGRLLIYEGQSTLPAAPQANTGSQAIPASFPSGRQYLRVRGQTSGTSADSTPDYWEVKTAPIADIIAPSYTSGEDFATTVVGNPWDMEGTDDVNVSWTDGDPAQAGLSYGVSGGVLNLTNHDDGVASCSGPWPHRPLALNQGGHTPDTSKYRYLSYRYKADNAPDQGDGGVMRVRWLSTSKWWAGRTDDISLYNSGWNVYKLDLANVALEAEMSGWTSTSWDVFQLMVNESHRAWTGHLDWVRLTAANEAQGSYTVGWNLVNVPDVQTATVYWDADRDWTNGLASAGQVYVPPTTTVPPPPPGPEFVYLPSVSRNYNPEAADVDAQFSLVLGTSGLSVGSSYWVAIKLEDGYNTVWWYSELPVTIKS